MSDNVTKADIAKLEDRLMEHVEKSQAALETRLLGSQAALETRLLESQTALEMRLLERIEKSETNLLKEFRKWAVPFGGKVKVTEFTTETLRERMDLLEERMNDLENSRK